MIARAKLFGSLIIAILYMVALLVVALISPDRARREVRAIGKSIGTP
jgi:hypothetical protein